jgi:hypothetical protein
MVACPGKPVDVNRLQFVCAQYLVVRPGILIENRKFYFGPVADLVDFELIAHACSFVFHSLSVKLDPR